MTTMTTNYPRFKSLSEPAKVVSTPCHRCGGAGGYKGWPGFTCYRCGGTCKDPTYREWGFPASWSDSEIEEWNDKRERRNAKARERSAAKREAERLAGLKVAEELLPKCHEARETYYALLNETDSRPGYEWRSIDFIDDVFNKAVRFKGDISAKAIAAAEKAAERTLAEVTASEAEKAARGKAPEGRVEAEGLVLMTKWYDNDFGGSFKMLVELDSGAKVFGTVPAAIADDDGLGKGARVAFTATFAPKPEDPSFACYKRPAKARLVEPAPEEEGAS